MPDGFSHPQSADIAHIGDFTVDNWGDRLYPIALRHLLRENEISLASLTHYAYRAGTLPGGTSARRMHPHALNHEVALVGGGDLIRADYFTVAQDRLNLPSGRRNTRFNKLRGRVVAARLPSGAGPWLPAAGWGERTRVSLVSVGVHPLPAERSVREAVAKLDFAWVRTNEAAERLSSAGMSSDRILIAPDMIFTHPWLNEAETLRAEGRAIASAMGIREPPVVFQAAGFHGWDPQSVEAALNRLKRYPVATLALGRYAGEDRLLGEAARRAGVPGFNALSARQTMALLAYAGCVVTSSMHAAIVAAALHVPVVDAGTGKTRSALAVCPSPPDIVYCRRDEICDAVINHVGTVPVFDRSANTAPIRHVFAQVLKAVGAGESNL